jgi:drug/metabolite transporter (DMT)-like permease
MLPVLRLVGALLPRERRAWAWAGAISIGNVVLSAPFFAALGARIWLSERLTGRQALGLVIGFGGILLIVGTEGEASGSDVGLGIVVCLSGALAWAAASCAAASC